MKKKLRVDLIANELSSNKKKNILSQFFKRIILKQFNMIKIGFIDPGNPDSLTRQAIACPALPLCGLAITEAERTLPEVLSRINHQLSRLNIKKS